MAGQQHFIDVVAGALVKLPHVERPRLEVMEISFDLQALQDALLHEVHVPDLVPGLKTRKKGTNTKYLMPWLDEFPFKVRSETWMMKWLMFENQRKKKLSALRCLERHLWQIYEALTMNFGATQAKQ